MHTQLLIEKFHCINNNNRVYYLFALCLKTTGEELVTSQLKIYKNEEKPTKS